MLSCQHVVSAVRTLSTCLHAPCLPYLTCVVRLSFYLLPAVLATEVVTEAGTEVATGTRAAMAAAAAATALTAAAAVDMAVVVVVAHLARAHTSAAKQQLLQQMRGR